MAQQTPLHFVFYFAAPPEKVWEGFVSPESNRIIFGGSELEVELTPGGPMATSAKSCAVTARSL